MMHRPKEQHLYHIGAELERLSMLILGIEHIDETGNLYIAVRATSAMKRLEQAALEVFEMAEEYKRMNANHAHV